MLGDHKSLFPLKILEDDDFDTEKTYPFVFAFHGTDDTAVPDAGTLKFASLWEVCSTPRLPNRDFLLCHAA